MAPAEEPLTESNSNINTINTENDLPTRRFSITLELSLFLTMLAMSLSGLTMSAMMIVVYSMMDQLGPWWYLLTAIPLAVTGNFTILFTGAFCYISDVTTSGARSFRMTLLEVAVSAGSIIGLVASPYLIEAIGNVYLMLVVSAIMVVAYAFTNIYLSESLTGALSGGLCSVLDLLLVKEMVTECFKRRPNKGRDQILLLVVANCMVIFIMYGLFGSEFYYTREKISWSLKDYNVYSAANTVVSSLGAFLGIALLQKLMNMSDLSVVNLALVLACVEYLIKAFAKNTGHMYIAAAVALFKTLPSPLIRSMLTKILPVEDIAKIFAFISALEGLCPLLAPIIYLPLYRGTISIFPGSIFVLSSCISLSCFVMVGFVQYYRWNLTSTYQPLSYGVTS